MALFDADPVYVSLQHHPGLRRQIDKLAAAAPSLPVGRGVEMRDPQGEIIADFLGMTA